MKLDDFTAPVVCTHSEIFWVWHLIEIQISFISEEHAAFFSDEVAENNQKL
jgi:hypothetical protein